MASIETESNVLQLALATANAGTFIYQTNRQHLSWDERSREIFGTSDYSYSGNWKDWAKTFKNSPFADVNQAISNQLVGDSIIDVSYELQCTDGVTRSIRTIANVIRDNSDAVLAVSGIHVDISEKAEMAKSLALAQKRQASQSTTTDSLTKVLNSSTLRRDSTTVFNIACRYKRPYSLISIELDDAQEIETQHGKNARRAALVSVSDKVRCKIRDVDMAGRLSANQFLVVLPETGPLEAENVAHSLCSHINSLSISVDGGTQRVSCSLGVAGTATANDTTLQTLLKEAELQRQVALKKGGNTVAIGDYPQSLASNPQTCVVITTASEPSRSSDSLQLIS